jgi:hypothetical protein
MARHPEAPPKFFEMRGAETVPAERFELVG